jgi:hypothetical protein
MLMADEVEVVIEDLVAAADAVAQRWEVVL